MIRRRPLLLWLGLTASCALAESDPAVTLTRLADRVRVEAGGQWFTEYIYGDGARRPYLYPILAADGTPLTRDFPMQSPAGEEQDHPHHRSLWFAHSSVNGIDFWNEDPAGGNTPKGRIVNDTLTTAADGPAGVIHATEQWLGPAGELVCTSETTLRFQATAAGRFIDCTVTLHARPEAPLLLGDNKDGVMAIRLAQWLTLPHQSGSRPVPGRGHIVTAKGDRDAAAWGRRADWCDYHAPHDGQTYGVAIFDHPQNLRHPTWWMARDYGLFAANPLGRHDFEGRKDQPHLGDHVIPAGGALTLRYRFYFHLGDEIAAQVAAHYAGYVAEK